MNSGVRPMPIYEYGCHGCGEITEHFIRGDIPPSVACSLCESEDTVKLISRVNFKLAKKGKYSDDFLERTLPAFRHKKETAQYFAEGKGSDESKITEISERIGERIDREIQGHFRKKK